MSRPQTSSSVSRDEGAGTGDVYLRAQEQHPDTSPLPSQTPERDDEPAPNLIARIP